jgi:two-component system CheB/CheR fusion protein
VRNSKAEELWGLRAEEVERVHLMNLDFGLPTARLMPAIRSCLAGERGAHEVVLDATNRRGRRIECRVTVAPLVGRQDGRPQGVIVLMDEQRPAPVAIGAAGTDGGNGPGEMAGGNVVEAAPADGETSR